MATYAPVSVPVGSDCILPFYVVTGDDVLLRADCLVGATTLAVSPLISAIGGSETLRFGNVLFSLSAPANAGAVTVSIIQGTGAVRAGTRGRRVQDITGWGMRWVLKDSAGDADALALLSKTVGSGISIVSGSQGSGQVQIDRADTVDGSDVFLIEPGRYYHALARTDSGSFVPILEGEFAIERGPIH